MSQNLVEGGARRGKFQTRNSRQVHLHTEFDFLQAAVPGKEPVARKCWKGTIYQGDGKTVDTEGVWELSGAYQNTNGVIQQRDLVLFVGPLEGAEPEAVTAAILGEVPESVTALKNKIAEALRDVYAYRVILAETADVLGESDYTKLPERVRGLIEANKALKRRNRQQPETTETASTENVALSAA